MMTPSRVVNPKVNDELYSSMIRLMELNDEYRKGTPLVDDEEYDRLHEYYKTKYPDHPFFNQVEPEAIDSTGRPKVKHVVPMKSLMKCYTHAALTKWLIQVSRVALELNIKDPIISISAKLDGVAAENTKKYLISRGDGDQGLDITSIRTHGLYITNTGVTGTGEIVVVRDYFSNHLSQEYSHPRTLVAGITNTADITSNDTYMEFLRKGIIHFVHHDNLPKAFVPLSELLSVEGEKILNDISHDLRSINYYTDGIVLKVEDTSIQERLGSTKAHPKWMVARKYSEYLSPLTKVIDVEMSVSDRGYVTPILVLDPVEINGTVINKVSMGSIKAFKNSGIVVGTEVIVEKKGDVIPVIYAVIQDGVLIKSKQ